VSYTPDNEDSMGMLSFDFGNVTGSTSSPCYASEVCHDNGIVAISAANSPETADSPSYSTWIPSPHSVLYKNLHHKFGSVLAMCELDLTMKSNPLKVNS
jgi:hypothetical protein